MIEIHENKNKNKIKPNQKINNQIEKSCFVFAIFEKKSMNWTIACCLEELLCETPFCSSSCSTTFFAYEIIKLNKH